MFIAHDVSLELIRELRVLLPAIQRFDRDLATQLRTAATSVTLNLSEGQRSGGGNQRRHYEIAHGSANEVKGALAVAQAWGLLADPSRARAILDRLLALLWRLTHPKHDDGATGAVRRPTRSPTGGTRSRQPHARAAAASA
jgi:four helix bundle protein